MGHRALTLALVFLVVGCGTPQAAAGGGGSVACVPNDPCGGQGAAIGDPCGALADACTGKRVACPCAVGGTCAAGVCTSVETAPTELEPPHDVRPCDPWNPCRGPQGEGGRCGEVSAGCPGVSVTCGCAGGLACVDGTCRAPAPSGPCRADADHCCMPDGRLVVPGGCQPSYPPNMQAATRRNADGTCEQIPCYLRCLPQTARIDTPSGPVPVSALAVGDLVYTRDATGARIARPVLRVGSVPVTGAHSMIELTLDDGRIARASAGHPVSRGGATFGELRVGDRIDGAAIVAVRAIPYAGSHTWDLLPAGPTGEYWADGVRVGSTFGP